MFIFGYNQQIIQIIQFFYDIPTFESFSNTILFPVSIPKINQLQVKMKIIVQKYTKLVYNLLDEKRLINWTNK